MVNMKGTKKLKELEFLSWSQFEKVEYDADKADMEIIQQMLQMDFETEKY